MKTKLSNEEKNLADILFSLQTHAFDCLKNRQQYEWRFSLSLWTALIILLGFLLKGETPLLNGLNKVALILFGIIIGQRHLA